jgi:hypothetical protein
MDITKLKVNDPFEQFEDKEYWGPLTKRFMHRCKDYDILSMLRVDAKKG